MNRVTYILFRRAQTGNRVSKKLTQLKSRERIWREREEKKSWHRKLTLDKNKLPPAPTREWTHDLLITCWMVYHCTIHHTVWQRSKGEIQCSVMLLVLAQYPREPNLSPKNMELKIWWNGSGTRPTACHKITTSHGNHTGKGRKKGGKKTGKGQIMPHGARDDKDQ